MTDPTNPAPAPGWYPDASGAQRWWDGRGWTDHVAAPAAVAAGYERPRLPEGTKVDNAWIWVVVCATFVAAIPVFFWDFTGYMRGVFALESGSTVGLGSWFANFVTFYVLIMVLSAAAYALTVVAAFRDYKHLVAVGVVRPFHWAFAFLYAIVYLIGRHVVLRKVVHTSGAPLWVYIGLTVLYSIGSIIWAFVMMQQLFVDISSMYPTYGTYS